MEISLLPSKLSTSWAVSKVDFTVSVTVSVQVALWVLLQQVFW